MYSFIESLAYSMLHSLSESNQLTFYCTLMYVKSGIMLLKLYFISYDTINTPLGDMDDGDNNMRKKLFLKTSNLLNRLQNEQKNDQSILFPYMTNEEKDILKYVSIELKRYRDDDL